MVRKCKRVLLLGAIVGCFLLGGLLADKAPLRSELLRLHVVGASDSAEDQAVKLRVRDAVIASLQDGLQDLTDLDQAVSYVQEIIPALEETADRVLEKAGFSDRAKISLALEEFPLRVYDTFSLPSGVYQALRIVIGEGEGQNWWCVVFPGLCLTQKGENIQEVSTFSDTLNDTITGKYEIRFWLLDQLGRIENFFHSSTEES